MALSQAAFEPGVPVVFVASGEGFADALAAGAAAGVGWAPTPGDEIAGAVEAAPQPRRATKSRAVARWAKAVMTSRACAVTSRATRKSVCTGKPIHEARVCW